MIITPKDYSPNAFYHLMTQTLIPRPIAWILSQNPNASYNLAPFSYFTPISASPPLLMVSVGKKSQLQEKDTRANILRDQICVVHIASTGQVDAVNESSKAFEFDVSEVDALNIQLAPWQDFSLPRVKACKVALGCNLHDEFSITDSDQHLLILKIEQLFIEDDLAQYDEQGRIFIDADKLDPLARLGGNQYASLQSPFERKRP